MKADAQMREHVDSIGDTPWTGSQVLWKGPFVRFSSLNRALKAVFPLFSLCQSPDSAWVGRLTFQLQRNTQNTVMEGN